MIEIFKEERGITAFCHEFHAGVTQAQNTTVTYNQLKTAFSCITMQPLMPWGIEPFSCVYMHRNRVTKSTAVQFHAVQYLQKAYLDSGSEDKLSDWSI